jgi:hypothetical protein|tara:strand:+ start:257 stop:448 length:192 start_codon:yes stop_codon:yes gene_type:complete
MTSETLEEKKNSRPENATVPSSGNDRVYLTLSLVAGLCLVLSTIAAGYVHGHMSITAVLKNLG